MSSLSDIPVRFEGGPSSPEEPGGLGGGVLALLHEILALLDRLSASGEPGEIDLRSMPMVPGDRQRLSEALGAGEVRAEIDAGGRTRVCETGFSGVWWIEHLGPGGDLLAEAIEVTDVPRLLASHPDDTRTAAAHLRARLRENSETNTAV